MRCEREEKIKEGSLKLTFQWLTLMPLDIDTTLLDHPGLIIVETTKDLFTLLASQAHAFEDALSCLQFTFTEERKRSYVVPKQMSLFRTTVMEGDPLFAPALDMIGLHLTGA